MASRFGRLSVQLNSQLVEGKITGSVQLLANGQPGPVQVRIRLPHPDRRKAVSATGGSYDPVTESLSLDDFSGQAEFTLYF